MASFPIYRQNLRKDDLIIARNGLLYLKLAKIGKNSEPSYKKGQSLQEYTKYMQSRREGGKGVNRPRASRSKGPHKN